VPTSIAQTWIVSQAIASVYDSLFGHTSSDLQNSEILKARSRCDSVIQRLISDSTQGWLTTEACALLRYNTQYLKSNLVSNPEIRGVILNSTRFDSLIVRAKPDTSFGVGDTVIKVTATVRWPSQFNITLGNVTSSYGFAKVDAPVTVGSYTYQKFRTTTHAPISWQAGQEYTLFSVPISGTCGAETFELTNALSGGEWFVDINYLDKTDTTFYASAARSFAFSNKADNSGSTYYNGARHMAVHGKVLHEGRGCFKVS
jgi:hypothetical protein